MEWETRGGLVLVGLVWGSCALCWRWHPEWFPASLRVEESARDPWGVDSLLVFLEDIPSRPAHARKLNWEDRTGFKASEEPERVLDLNRVDSAALEALPRIGGALAGRIVRYRESLGGFVSTDQLREVWGIYPDQIEALLPRFRVAPDGQVRLCADTASWDALRRHPYIRSEGARAIERYRKHHPLSSVEDLANSPAIGDSLLRRWRPYLVLCESQRP